MFTIIKLTGTADETARAKGGLALFFMRIVE
jgi:hypothetical protein